MTYIVKFTGLARRDLEEIVAYIAVHADPLTAASVLEAIEKRCTDLSEFPDRGNVPKEFAAINNRRYRELHYKPYRIVYRVKDNEVLIQCVVDGRRNMADFLRQRLSRID